jgi:hypothetical protein
VRERRRLAGPPDGRDAALRRLDEVAELIRPFR